MDGRNVRYDRKNDGENKIRNMSATTVGMTEVEIRTRIDGSREFL